MASVLSARFHLAASVVSLEEQLKAEGALNKPFLPMLAMRGPVHLISNLIGRISAIACGVLLIGGMVFDSFEIMALILGILAGAVSYGCFWFRWWYDTELLKRVPEGQSITLYQ